MPRGGSRKHAADCKCGNCPVIGRRKQERPTNANVAQKVLNQAKAETLWLSLIVLEKNRLGIGEDGKLLPAKAHKDGAITGPDYQGRFSIIPLTNLLHYLEDRAYGKTVDTVNHLHDKPIEMNVKLKMSELIRDVRQRKQDYERNRK